jgi:hypothetical protein
MGLTTGSAEQSCEEEATADGEKMFFHDIPEICALRTDNANARLFIAGAIKAVGWSSRMNGVALRGELSHFSATRDTTPD